MGESGLTPAELAELMGEFNAVTARLQESHATLQEQVARLRTELRDANEQLRRSERLAALGEMAAGIAHEIRNPLGSIRLYARMLTDDLEDRPEQRGIAEKIGAAVLGLNAVVGDVLTFARDFRVRPERVRIAELFARALAACESHLAPVRVLLDAPESLEIMGDPALLQRALVNLIRNALEAMEEAGSEPRVLSLDALGGQADGAAGGADGLVVLRVRDTGPGVSQEVMARMFNPFYTTRSAGTGLGLAIVHRIAEAHGGRVTVRHRADDRPVSAEVACAAGTGGACIELCLPLDCRVGAHEPLEVAG